MKRTFVLKAKLSGEKVPVFIDGEEPGVIAVAEYEYNLTDEEYRSPQFAMDIIDKQENLVKELISVDITEIK